MKSRKPKLFDGKAISLKARLLEKRAPEITDGRILNFSDDLLDAWILSDKDAGKLSSSCSSAWRRASWWSSALGLSLRFVRQSLLQRIGSAIAYVISLVFSSRQHTLFLFVAWNVRRDEQLQIEGNTTTTAMLV
jgi:hypothetical protein